jgi:hypothetical protein
MSSRSLTLAVLATTLTGCFFGGTAGSGTEATEDRTVDGFTEISVSGIYTVEAVVGPEVSVSVVADDNILPLIQTTVSNGRLSIETEGSIRPKVQPVVRVTVPSLEFVDLSGATSLIATGLTGEKFRLDTSGASKATLAGAVESLEIDVSGAAKITAADLNAKNAEIDVSGAAKVDVTVSDKLDVEVSGAGKVTYGGEPTVTKDLSGAGSVSPRT